MEEQFIVLHFPSVLLFVCSCLKLDAIGNVVFHIHLFYNNQYGALLCFYIAADAYEYIEYNYGFVMLLSLYGVGIIVKSWCKG